MPTTAALVPEMVLNSIQQVTKLLGNAQRFELWKQHDPQELFALLCDIWPALSKLYSFTETFKRRCDCSVCKGAIFQSGAPAHQNTLLLEVHAYFDPVTKRALIDLQHCINQNLNIAEVSSGPAVFVFPLQLALTD